MTDKNPMDSIFEVHSLAGETLALQAVLFGILPKLAALAPDIRSAIAAGFDDAANVVEQIALKYGDQAHPSASIRSRKTSFSSLGANFRSNPIT